MSEIDWESVPDSQLEETYMERLEGLKEMVPEKVRGKLCSAADWSWWLAKGTFSLTKQTLWVTSTSALIMILPYFIVKELGDIEKAQVKQQHQLLLGRP